MSRNTAPERTSPAEKLTPLGIATLLLRRSCMLYTAITVVVLLIHLIFGDASRMIGASNFLLFLPFSLCVALAGLVRTADKLPTWGKVLLHPLLVLGGFYLCIYLPTQIKRQPSAAMTLALLVGAAAIYGIIMLVIFLCTRHKRQKKVDNTPYESQFKTRP